MSLFKLRFQLGFVVLLSTTTLLVSGCATMSQAECTNADWYIIGLEDGSLGRPLSYIGNHRSACSEYGVIPDLERYKQGRMEGLARFCTEENGYQVALRGARNPGVCPTDLVRTFNRGFENGHRLYLLRSDIAQLEKEIRKGEARLKWLEETIANNEQLIISSSTTEQQRRDLLADNKAYNLELSSLRESLPLMRSDLQSLYAREADLRRR